MKESSTHIQSLEPRVLELGKGTTEDLHVTSQLRDIQISLEHQFERYLGDDYSGCWMIRLAELLYTHPYILVTPIAKIGIIRSILPPLCTLEERTSSYELDKLAKELEEEKEPSLKKRHRSAARKSLRRKQAKEAG